MLEYLADSLNDCWNACAPIVSTIRPLTFPVLRRWKTSLIDSSGCVSMIAFTLSSAAKLKASSKSSRVPTIEPRMVYEFSTTLRIETGKYYSRETAISWLLAWLEFLPEKLSVSFL